MRFALDQLTYWLEQRSIASEADNAIHTDLCRWLVDQYERGAMVRGSRTAASGARMTAPGAITPVPWRRYAALRHGGLVGS
jgi:hypothetical protein